MFQTNCERRDFYNVSNILEPRYAEVRENMPTTITENLVGIDKHGRPIKLQSYHKWDPVTIKRCDLHQWWQWNFRVMEQMSNVVFPYCSQLAEKRIDRFILIFDLGDC